MAEERVDTEQLEADRLVDLGLDDVDRLREAASEDSGTVTVEGVDDAPGPVPGEVEIVVGEPVTEGPEELTNADFGGGDEVVLPEDRVVEVLPDLARLAAVAATRSAAWGVGRSLQLTRRLVRATVDPHAAAELVEDIGEGVRGAAREFLGVSELEARIDSLTPVGNRLGQQTRARPARREAPRLSPEEALRKQGAELLRQSAALDEDQHLHPAFGRILGELAPDEGRILRLLSGDGPQPIVDVRSVNLIGVGSQLVAQNLNMIGMGAGLRYPDRVEAYLVNLERLGLICFSDKPLDDAITYQVLEAQPQVMDTIQATSRAKSDHRSLRLTAFGSTFAEICFPQAIEETTALESGGGDEDQNPSMPAENDELGS